LALNETDIDERRGSLLIRHGKATNVTCLDCRSDCRQPGCGSVPRAARSATNGTLAARSFE
jgi:hypothetical protein